MALISDPTLDSRVITKSYINNLKTKIMEKKIEEEKKISVSEKLTALQIAQAMGGFDVMTIANNEKYLSALFNRAERILKWANSY